jgi:predicted glycosyltransferase
VAGPFFPERGLAELADRCRTRDRLDLRRSVPALAPLLAGAAGSLSQCGYNTALEVVNARVPAVVVPYVHEGEDEQLRRARRLSELGLLRLLHPADAHPAALADAMRGIGGFAPARATVDMDGARQTLEALSAMVSERRPLEGALR